MTVASALVMAVAGALCSVQSAPQPPAVVELFTSQGCSSCPPADRWLGTLGRYGERVIALSLHVGYWDYIGWKDPFARREFTERQRELAGANGSGVYTPGVFVQGRELRDWSSAPRFDAAVKAAQQPSSATRLSLSVQSLSPAAVVAAAMGEGPPGARLWLALVQDASATAVNAGENRGETLRNHHVVRDWRGPFPVGGTVQSLGFPVATDTQPTGWSIVALVDQPKGATLQAVRLPLARCASPSHREPR
jgi:hypothetical protein